MNYGPIFIVGAPRSGTTLLQYMLRAHPRISLPTGESHFFIPLYRNAATFGDLSKLENKRAVLSAMYQQSAEFLDTDLHGMKFNIEELGTELQEKRCDTMQAIIAGLFERNAQGEGKVRWGDKTPYYVLHIPKLLKWFPDAQIIHLIRDGRDVALSLLGRRHDFGVYNVYLGAKYWQQYVEVGREHGRRLGPDVYLEIRYEDILQDQKGTLQNICTFLGEEYDDALLNYKKSSGVGKTPLLGKPVQRNNAGKWRTKMNVFQIKVFEATARETLLKLGYEVLNATARLPLPARAWYRVHNRVLCYWHKSLNSKSKKR